MPVNCKALQRCSLQQPTVLGSKVCATHLYISCVLGADLKGLDFFKNSSSETAFQHHTAHN